MKCSSFAIWMTLFFACQLQARQPVITPNASNNSFTASFETSKQRHPAYRGDDLDDDSNDAPGGYYLLAEYLLLNYSIPPLEAQYQHSFPYSPESSFPPSLPDSGDSGNQTNSTHYFWQASYTQGNQQTRDQNSTRTEAESWQQLSSFFSQFWGVLAESLRNKLASLSQLAVTESSGSGIVNAPGSKGKQPVIKPEPQEKNSFSSQQISPGLLRVSHDVVRGKKGEDEPPRKPPSTKKEPEAPSDINSDLWVEFLAIFLECLGNDNFQPLHDWLEENPKRKDFLAHLDREKKQIIWDAVNSSSQSIPEPTRQLLHLPPEPPLKGYNQAVARGFPAIKRTPETIEKPRAETWTKPDSEKKKSSPLIPKGAPSSATRSPGATRLNSKPPAVKSFSHSQALASKSEPASLEASSAPKAVRADILPPRYNPDVSDGLGEANPFASLMSVTDETFEPDESDEEPTQSPHSSLSSKKTGTPAFQGKKKRKKTAPKKNSRSKQRTSATVTPNQPNPLTGSRPATQLQQKTGAKSETSSITCQAPPGANEPKSQTITDPAPADQPGSLDTLPPAQKQELEQKPLSRDASVQTEKNQIQKKVQTSSEAVQVHIPLSQRNQLSQTDLLTSSITSRAPAETDSTQALSAKIISELTSIRALVDHCLHQRIYGDNLWHVIASTVQKSLDSNIPLLPGLADLLWVAARQNRNALDALLILHSRNVLPESLPTRLFCTVAAFKNQQHRLSRPVRIDATIPDLLQTQLLSLLKKAKELKHKNQLQQQDPSPLSTNSDLERALHTGWTLMARDLSDHQQELSLLHRQAEVLEQHQRHYEACLFRSPVPASARPEQCMISVWSASREDIHHSDLLESVVLELVELAKEGGNVPGGKKQQLFERLVFELFNLLGVSETDLTVVEQNTLDRAMSQLLRTVPNQYIAPLLSAFSLNPYSAHLAESLLRLVTHNPQLLEDGFSPDFFNFRLCFLCHRSFFNPSQITCACNEAASGATLCSTCNQGWACSKCFSRAVPDMAFRKDLKRNVNSANLPPCTPSTELMYQSLTLYQLGYHHIATLPFRNALAAYQINLAQPEQSLLFKLLYVDIFDRTGQQIMALYGLLHQSSMTQLLKSVHKILTGYQD